MTASNALSAAKELLENPIILLACTLLDVLFFVTLGFFGETIREWIVGHALDIARFSAQILRADPSTSIIGLLTSHQIIGSLIPVVLLTALLFAVIGGLYVLFHGPIWYQLNSNQNNWKHYSKEFSTFVAYLLPIWIVYFFVEMMIDLRYEVIIQLGGAASQVVLWIPSVIMGLALLVIIPSHSVLSLKKGWALWKKQPGALFVTLLLPFLSIMAASTLVDLVWTQSPELGFLLGVPAISVLTWARKFIILEVSDVL